MSEENPSTGGIEVRRNRIVGYGVLKESQQNNLSLLDQDIFEQTKRTEDPNVFVKKNTESNISLLPDEQDANNIYEHELENRPLTETEIEISNQESDQMLKTAIPINIHSNRRFRKV